MLAFRPGQPQEGEGTKPRPNPQGDLSLSFRSLNLLRLYGATAYSAVDGREPETATPQVFRSSALWSLGRLCKGDFVEDSEPRVVKEGTDVGFV